MPCLAAIRAVYPNLNCLSFFGQMHDVPKFTWLLDQRHERQEKPAPTKEKNPTTSLYRMYKYLVVGYTAGLHSEMEYFFDRLIERGLPRRCCPAIIVGEEAEAELHAREVVRELQPSWAKAVHRLTEQITYLNIFW
ncbi:hypothetical protein BFJ72_g13414 [Fusarium proliferatum]|uniref:Uncharacterized protein n=1 Tax=Gibberella intermedia TaxID=948311 RepID=A0A420SCJ0_GIBIN|nr:hypothetical protein BFJ72_g13414 [Fusarium proliferatum]